VEFVTLYRPHRLGHAVPEGARLERLDGGYRLEAALVDGQVVVLLPTDDAATLKTDGATTQGKILVQRLK
jgi:hypothetical protein